MTNTTNVIAEQSNSASLSWGISSTALSSALDHEISPPQDEADNEEQQLSYYASQSLTLASWMWLNKERELTSPRPHPFSRLNPFNIAWKPLQPVRQWLDALEVHDRKLAHWLCQNIPTQCPFERDVNVLGKTLFHIPPLCKLNPLYDEIVFLRFRAMSYLADECGEDVSMYC